MKQQLLVKYSNVKQKSFCEKLLRRKTPYSQLEDRMIVSNLPDPEIGDNKISTSKYHLVSFPIFNLLEQFTKPSNVYFLLIGVLQMIPAISVSNGKPTMFFPLTIVVLVSMVKDFFEDWKRRESDKRENQTQIQILNQFGYSRGKSENILVGNIIKVQKDEYFPCDVLLLKHGAEARLAYVETKNLDGETNLKLKKVPQILKFDERQGQEELQNLNLQVSYQRPNPFISSFNGNIKDGNKKYPLDANNVILRGCSLKINSFAIGLCLYNGHQSKIMLNGSQSATKRSSLQKILNSYFKFICVFQVLITLVCSIIYGGIVSVRYSSLKEINESPEFMLDLVSDWGSWFISISNFIPISLLVSVELVRYGQGFLLRKDEKCRSQGKYVEVQTSSVNEQLGQIEYVLSDKTGTLTQNIMQFKCLLIDNENYGWVSQEDEKVRKESLLTFDSSMSPAMKQIRDRTNTDRNHYNHQEMIKMCQINKDVPFVAFPQEERHRLTYDLIQSNQQQLEAFSLLPAEKEKHKRPKINKVHSVMLHLSLCHNVIKQESGYSSSSPDELALVNFAKFMGYSFVDKSDDNVMIVHRQRVGEEGQKEPEILQYKLLRILEFSSDRKRMSVIVRDRWNRILLLSKGADDVMISRSNSNEDYISELNGHLHSYACQGLRTLVLAYRQIDEEAYQQWDRQYEDAVTQIGVNRMDKIYELQNGLEKEMTILGATAIEDKLQDEAKETIQALKRSGIKVWMLTGDKKQTAISIGFSCGLIDKCQKITLDCEPEHAENLISNVHSMLPMIRGNKVTIVSGEILTKMNDQMKDKLSEILKLSSSVICCRVSPKEKQNLTRMVKEWGRVLAVGDGANDVNMINAANVGIGVRGIEGSQATRAADYVVSEFKILKRIILYYGINYYYRNSQLTLFNLYKNILVTFPILAYGPLCIFSSTYIYDNWVFQFYNINYTSLPIIIFGLFNIKYCEQELDENPRFYGYGQNSVYFNMKTIIRVLATSCFFASIFVYFGYYATGYRLVPNGYMTFQSFTGMLMLNICVLSVNARIFMVSNQISFFMVFSVIGSIASYYIVFLFVDHILYSDIKNVLECQFSSPVFWLVLFVSTFLIESIEWTINKWHQPDHNSHSDTELVEEELTERGITKQRSNKLTGKQPHQIIQGMGDSGGYAFAEDEQRSLHLI